MTDDKPLRRDAARNRLRILDAAGELFGERGLAVTLNDIAHHAGVGVGTVYRHFPDKHELIETLFETRVDEMVAVGEAALADPDPWRGLMSMMQGSLEMQAKDRGLHELVNAAPEGRDRVGRVRERMLPIAEQLVARAQAAGSLRNDLGATDLAICSLMLGAVLDASRDTSPELWRRYLTILARGMAGGSAEPPASEIAPPSVADVDRVLAAAKAPPRR